jgi:hypothetical protein
MKARYFDVHNTHKIGMCSDYGIQQTTQFKGSDWLCKRWEG